MYNVIKTNIISEGEEKAVYGLKHEDGTIVENVSANETVAERLAEFFSEQGLASYQLEDVLSDMIDTENGLEI